MYNIMTETSDPIAMITDAYATKLPYLREACMNLMCNVIASETHRVTGLPVTIMMDTTTPRPTLIHAYVTTIDGLSLIDVNGMMTGSSINDYLSQYANADTAAIITGDQAMAIINQLIDDRLLNNADDFTLIWGPENQSTARAFLDAFTAAVRTAIA
jgi:hypothetical protein